MREILFRGKRVDNGEWVCSGNLIHFNEGNECYIPVKNSNCTCTHDINDNIIEWNEVMFCKVIPDTVGQYTGLTDKNGKRIFEGDIVDCWSEGVNAQGTVQQRRDGLWIIFPAWQKTIMWGLCPDEYSNTSVEVIGNIYDNPELIAEVEG